MVDDDGECGLGQDSLESAEEMMAFLTEKSGMDEKA